MSKPFPIAILPRQDADSLIQVLTSEPVASRIDSNVMTRLLWSLASSPKPALHVVAAALDESLSDLGEPQSEASEAVHGVMSDLADDLVATMEISGIGLEKPLAVLLKAAKDVNPTLFHHLGPAVVADAIEARMDDIFFDPDGGPDMAGVDGDAAA